MLFSLQDLVIPSRDNPTHRLEGGRGQGQHPPVNASGGRPNPNGNVSARIESFLSVVCSAVLRLELLTYILATMIQAGQLPQPQPVNNNPNPNPNKRKVNGRPPPPRKKKVDPFIRPKRR